MFVIAVDEDVKANVRRYYRGMSPETAEPMAAFSRLPSSAGAVDRF
jgi:hypothetical protein